MTDFLADAETWLATVTQGPLSTSDTLTYQRTGEQDLDFTDQGVCVLQHAEAIDTGRVVALDVRTVEYLVPKTLINFGLGITEPLGGDLMIHEFPNGEIVTFEAAAFDGGIPWRWHDRSTHNIYRIQMQQIKVE